jgi:hypothetical protein
MDVPRAVSHPFKRFEAVAKKLLSRRPRRKWKRRKPSGPSGNVTNRGMNLRARLTSWLRVTAWRAIRDAPTTPRLDVSEEDIGQKEAERAKRERQSKEAR